ncbi:basic leucine zipper 34 [Cryptomeria japonica]|uniref:basic leucine zipper 34 n=1 Tax=Cryptomeria japonica TaxID=3369 RepID=UPI0025AC0C8E|nr:basic leucine zipper 34 [Cryptomeria japonica]XP_057867216.1 basic leucine zipper 34 [Cryptomeria japonica]XP_057867217.1 basic leucine zipper 34 [Cryptomeria japonica]XP_057867218.1 basic leucine zipper 34 [Cryptomeria japonica]XP_057867219.1 basic leucine zipper 34 [Cryptomeria japonica]XP_057867220.1 basic leucine zipper 34 [Cryptomeria japonica]XP_057867221.1 basic leucine zipper 34 [Cryptomeria japonica]
MAQQGTGDNSPANWGFTSSKLPQLPPKSPPFMGSSGQDSNNMYMGWHNFSFQGHSLKHQRTPSVGYLSQCQPSWIDDLLDTPSETPAKKGAHHRRSASDSLAFLEAPTNSNPIEEIAEEDEFDCRSAASIPSKGSQDFDRLDEEQLMSMFNDVEPFNKSQSNQSSNPPNHQTSALDNRCSDRQATSENPSTPSDHNSINEPSVEEKVMTVSGQFKSEPEVQSVNKSEQPLQTAKTEMPSSSAMELDPNIDPKRVKRILANRQSAQRSRVRKLQYISELERSVNALQTEVSTLSPRVTFLDHQRVILNVDNSALKQRIAALAQDKLFKDAHTEALKKEVSRLRQLYQEQQQHMQKEMHASSTGSFELQQQQFGKLEQVSSSQMMDQKPDISDPSPTHLKNTSGISDHRENNAANNHAASGSQILKGMMPSSCLMGESNKSLDERMMGGISSDYMVHNP